MPQNVLIIPDKFKGTLTAQAAAEAIAVGWRKARPEDTLELTPMSDGGDGFGEIISSLVGAGKQTTKTVDAAHRPLTVQWWWDAHSKTAVIESARIIGLALLPTGQFHPFDLDTTGLGAVLRAATALGARRCLMGIGGSATNDAGFGLARSIGWKFLDRDDREIEKWTRLNTLDRIVAPERVRWFEELTVAVDVQNPLLGPTGCSRIYGPQKGLRREDCAIAEKALRRLALVTARDLNRDCKKDPGVGAAGGLGFGLRCFFGARLHPGFDIFARYAELKRRVARANLVITAEGSIDKSTVMGKGVGEIAHYCKRQGIPCIGLAGRIGDPNQVGKIFAEARALTPDLTDAALAESQAAKWLTVLAGQVAESRPRK